jgi:DNA-directed RNA polymerase specialized sigma24 family protein
MIPSHEPCPMCGHSYEEEQIIDVNELAEQAISNLKFLNLGFSLGYLMTDLERSVYYHHQIRKCKFKEISKILNKSESTLTKAWNRCKLRGDKALEDSIL